MGNYSRYSTHILVVDDDPDIAGFAVETLLRAGYIATFALNAYDGMDKITTSPSLNLLVTDVVLPGLDGFKLAAMVLTRDPNVRILYTSGYVTLARELIAAGGPGYHMLEKPYWREDLLAAVRRALGEDSEPEPGAPRPRGRYARGAIPALSRIAGTIKPTRQ